MTDQATAVASVGDNRMPNKIFEYEGYVIFCEPEKVAERRFLAQALVRSTADEWGRGFYALGEFATAPAAVAHARAWAKSWIDYNLTPEDGPD